MTGRLRCFSFHSVKGGVGKSTLSTLTAVALAEEHPEESVVLVDMDLTGTSLADVLALEAPDLAEGSGEGLDVLVAPRGFHDRAETARLIEIRGDAPLGGGAIAVPFLNDYLLYEPQQTGAGDEIQEPNRQAFGWRLAGGPSNLSVLPSSALPRDLTRALPVIYDEEHGAFLEGRLEYLLSAWVPQTGTTYIVFDTPPTIPGLSRSVLNLALRLSIPEKTALSEDGYVPHPLAEADVEWSACVVATMDVQDLRAANRWLDLVGEAGRGIIEFVLNRAEGEAAQREALLHGPLGVPDAPGGLGPTETTLNPFVLDPVWVDESDTLRSIFRSEGGLPTPGEFLGAFLRRLGRGRA